MVECERARSRMDVHVLIRPRMCTFVRAGPWGGVLNVRPIDLPPNWEVARLLVGVGGGAGFAGATVEGQWRSGSTWVEGKTRRAWGQMVL